MKKHDPQAIEFQDRRLKYLFTSYEKGSMRAAADEMGLAASSISRHIAKLEDELGTELIRQGSHRITLTKAGEAVIEYYVARIAHHEALMGKLQELKTQQQNSAVIAIGEGLLGARAITALHVFLRDHKHVRAEFISAPSYEVQRMVTEDEAHLGVIFAPHPCAPFSRLFRLPQPLILVTHKNNPLTARSRLTLEDLRSEPLVLPGPKFRIREILEAACADTPFDIVPDIVSNSLSLILDFVRTGVGSTLLPQILVQEEIRSGTFKGIPIECPQMEATEIQIVKRRSRRLTQTSQDLATELAKAVHLAQQ